MLSAASAHIALPVNFLRYVSHGAGSGVRRKRPPDGSLPGEGQGEAKHRWKVLYVICGFSVVCAPG